MGEENLAQAYIALKGQQAELDLLLSALTNRKATLIAEETRLMGLLNAGRQPEQPQEAQEEPEAVEEPQEAQEAPQPPVIAAPKAAPKANPPMPSKPRIKPI